MRYSQNSGSSMTLKNQSKNHVLLIYPQLSQKEKTGRPHVVYCC